MNNFELLEAFIALFSSTGTQRRFQLLHCLLAQIERIVDINALRNISKRVVDDCAAAMGD